MFNINRGRIAYIEQSINRKESLMPGRKVPEAERREQILAAAVGVAAEAGLGGLTVRKIAEAAGISSGLVLFHYRSMETLRDALLDWLLERILRLDLKRIRRRWPLPPRERLARLVGEELAAARGLQPEITLLLEYWVASLRQPTLRARLVPALESYRTVFRTLAFEACGDEPVAAWTPEGFADAAVRSILGLGLETVLEPTATIEAHDKLFATLLAKD
jgi:AcrR family transcriptional regulator